MRLRRNCPLFGASLLLSSLLPPALSFYLPGVAPRSYHADEPVPLHVNRLTPFRSDTDPALHSTVAYDYYYPAFHFCQPADGPRDVGQESLGAVIFGDRIKDSPFALAMRKNETCKRLCGPTNIRAKSARFVNARIRQNYHLNWLVDGLPAGQQYRLADQSAVYYSRGFPLGAMAAAATPDGAGVPMLHNHYDIVLDYHEVRGGEYRVVGALVQPSSRGDATAACGEDGPPLQLDPDGETLVSWTYSVYWRPSAVAWAVRWDSYLRVEDPKIHWFSLANSTFIVVFLVGTVAAILTRALKRDFARYNRLNTFSLDDFSAHGAGDPGEDVQEDSGWKLVHGDVFRPPPSPLLLSVFLGNGAQLFIMTGITIVFALLGFLSPSNRGSLGTAVLVLYAVLGSVGGYVSARAHKAFGGEAWKQTIVLTPCFVPGLVFGTFFLLNLFLWGRASSGAVPFPTMLAIVGIWFLISVPLSFVGSWLGFKQPVRPLTFSPHALPRPPLTNRPGHPSPRPHQPDPPPNPPLDLLPPPVPLDAPGRRAALRRHLRRALLHHEQPVVRQDLLHVRLPVPGLRRRRRHLRRRHRHVRLLPAVRRELPLAVARLQQRRRRRHLHFWLRDHLLGVEVAVRGFDEYGAVRGVQCVDQLSVLYFDW